MPPGPFGIGWVWIFLAGAVLLAVALVGLGNLYKRKGGQTSFVRDWAVSQPKPPEPSEPIGASLPTDIVLQFNVKEGDVFEYAGGPFGGRTVITVADDALHEAYPDDATNNHVTVLNRRGAPVDFLLKGVSIKEQMPKEVWDISARLVFPEGPLNIGYSWEARQWWDRVQYTLVGITTLAGRKVAEIRSTAPRHGPITFWVELATGMVVRQEGKNRCVGMERGKFEEKRVYYEKGQDTAFADPQLTRPAQPTDLVGWEPYGETEDDPDTGRDIQRYRRFKPLAQGMGGEGLTNG